MKGLFSQFSMVYLDFPCSGRIKMLGGQQQQRSQPNTPQPAQHKSFTGTLTQVEGKERLNFLPRFRRKGVGTSRTNALTIPSRTFYQHGRITESYVPKGKRLLRSYQVYRNYLSQDVCTPLSLLP